MSDFFYRADSIWGIKHRSSRKTTLLWANPQREISFLYIYKPVIKTGFYFFFTEDSDSQKVLEFVTHC